MKSISYQFSRNDAVMNADQQRCNPATTPSLRRRYSLDTILTTSLLMHQGRRYATAAASRSA
jgi:hypothetical protein